MDRTQRQGRTIAAIVLMATALWGCGAMDVSKNRDVVDPSVPVQVPWARAGAIDAEVRLAMAATGARGVAIAVIDDGQVVHVAAHGERNAAGEPLRTDTIMYGASLTKTAFATLVLQLVDDGVLALDTPIAEYLARPLPAYPTEDRYAPWADLAGDSAGGR